jgi:NAD-dependent dihydropyrimidine dehydrogenase PreA subunit
MLGRLFVADDSCTSCGLCARACPATAITMRDGLPAWSLRCCACNRCINACPASAIQTSRARLVLVALANIAAMIAAGPAARGILQAAAPGSGGPFFGLAVFTLNIAVYAAFTALQIGPLDSVLRSIERKPALRRFFAAGHTKRFRRYLAPGFRPADRSSAMSTTR